MDAYPSAIENAPCLLIELTLSARNIVKGTIKKIKEGMVMAEIGLDIGNGDTISATISDESTKLGLKEGEEAMAVF